MYICFVLTEPKPNNEYPFRLGNDLTYISFKEIDLGHDSFAIKINDSCTTSCLLQIFQCSLQLSPISFVERKVLQSYGKFLILANFLTTFLLLTLTTAVVSTISQKRVQRYNLFLYPPNISINNFKLFFTTFLPHNNRTADYQQVK